VKADKRGLRSARRSYAEELAILLARLSGQERSRFMHNWRLFARAEQLPPPGDPRCQRPFRWEQSRTGVPRRRAMELYRSDTGHDCV
jgi:hypothetical protein